MSAKAIVYLFSLAVPMILGGWLIFDGMRAFVLGDYTTPRDGAYAGQLGPWASVVSAMGIEPRGSFMKAVHVGLGAVWIAAACWAAVQPINGQRALFAAANCSLWYLPVGTVLSLLELALVGWLWWRG